MEERQPEVITPDLKFQSRIIPWSGCLSLACGARSPPLHGDTGCVRPEPLTTEEAVGPALSEGTSVGQGGPHASGSRSVGRIKEQVAFMFSLCIRRMT